MGRYGDFSRPGLFAPFYGRFLGCYRYNGGRGKLHTLPPSRLSVFVTVDKEPIQKQNYGHHRRDSVDKF